MGRTYELTEDERLDLQWAAREVDDQVNAPRGPWSSGNAWSKDMKVRWAAAGRSPEFISYAALKKAVEKGGGSHVADCVAFALGVDRSRWRERRLAHERGAEPTVTPEERYPLLGMRLRLAKAARALRGERLPDEVWDYVTESLKALALKGTMTEQIADAAIDAALREVTDRSSDPLPEATLVDVTPDMGKLKRGKR